MSKSGKTRLSDSGNVKLGDDFEALLTPDEEPEKSPLDQIREAAKPVKEDERTYFSSQLEQTPGRVNQVVFDHNLMIDVATKRDRYSSDEITKYSWDTPLELIESARDTEIDILIPFDMHTKLTSHVDWNNSREIVSALSEVADELEYSTDFSDVTMAYKPMAEDYKIAEAAAELEGRTWIATYDADFVTLQDRYDLGVSTPAKLNQFVQ